MATSLSDYLTKTRQLLHDLSDVLYPVTDKIAYINDGMQQRDFLTGGNRQTLTVNCNVGAGSDTYTYAQLGNANIVDIISICLLYGAVRQVMMRLTKTRLNAYGRITTSFQSIPSAFAWVGQTIVLDCLPSSATFRLESDVTAMSTPLVLPNDTDPLPPPWTNPIPYYAASLAKMNARRLGEAEFFHDKFIEKCVQIPGMRVGMLPNAYSGRR